MGTEGSGRSPLPQSLVVASSRAGGGGGGESGECEHGEPGIALFLFAIFSVIGFVLVRQLPETLGESV